MKKNQIAPTQVLLTFPSQSIEKRKDLIRYELNKELLLKVKDYPSEEYCINLCIESIQVARKLAKENENNL